VVVKAHSLTFKSAVAAFKDNVENYLREEEADFETQYQVSIPFVLRGLLIHLMNEALDISHFMGEIECINQLLAGLVNSYKEAGNYFERYLTQLSLAHFAKIVQRIQFSITYAQDERANEESDSLWDTITVLDYFHKANSKREEPQQLSYKEFYNDSLNTAISLAEQYEEWIE
jgi:hypothetical protein